MKKAMLHYLRCMRSHDPFAGIVIRLGEWFEGMAKVDDFDLTKQWKKDNRPKAKQCFYNSQMFCCENLGYRYFEGFVLVGGFPIHHAWIVSRGRVFDFTLGAMVRQAKRAGVIYDEIPLY